MARDDILGVEVSSGRVLPEWIDVNNHHRFQRLYHAGRRMHVASPLFRVAGGSAEA